jgi:hypothetical protein
MQQVSHQTVKLSKGKHSSPKHGACVMELASMLAGEPFSDHPQSVSTPIASFLRAYNDMVDDERRQDLYEYAARTVGTVAPEWVEDLRAQRLISWAEEIWERRTRWSLLAGFRRRRLICHQGHQDPEAAARYAIQTISKVSNETHAGVLALVDELIATGADTPAAAARRCRVTPSEVDPVLSLTE